MTPLDIIKGALLALGEIEADETPETAEAANAFLELNRMYDSWSLEGITAWTHAVGAFALSPGQGEYTMGIGGTWNTPLGRPVKVKGARAFYLGLPQGLVVMPMGQFEQSLQGSMERLPPVEYLISGAPVSPLLQQWSQAAVPNKLGEDSAAPLKHIRIHPIPTVSMFLDVSYWTALAQFPAIDAVITFPVPGIEAALITELAMVLAPAYGRPLDPALAANVQRFKSRINEINGQIEIGQVSPAPPQ